MMRNSSRRAILAALAASALLALPGCAGTTEKLWRVADAAQHAAATAEQVIADGAAAKFQECLHTFPAKSPEYAACIKSWRDALLSWRHIRDTKVNPALRAAVAILNGKPEPGANCNGWASCTEMGVCAVFKAARELAPMLGDGAKGILEAVGAVEGVLCQ